VRNAAAGWLALIDRIIVYAFAVEVGLRFYAHRNSYFKSGWNVFDFIILMSSQRATKRGFKRRNRGARPRAEKNGIPTLLDRRLVSVY
jgi:hypothetical protein